MPALNIIQDRYAPTWTKSDGYTYQVRPLWGLAAPSVFSINNRKGIFGKDYSLGFMPGTLDYDHRITYFSSLCYDPAAVDRVSDFIALS